MNDERRRFMERHAEPDGRTTHLTQDNRPRHATAYCDVCDALATFLNRKSNDPNWYKEQYKGNDPAWITRLIKLEKDKLDDCKIRANNPHIARWYVMNEIQNKYTTVRYNGDKASIEAQTGPDKPYLTMSDFITDAIERYCMILESKQGEQRP